jgi:ketosteroid isomerase-like protein
VTPTELAERYFAAVRAKDIDAFVALFAEDACFILPGGQTFEGKQAIRETQEKVFASGSPFPTPLALVAGDNGLAAEVEARLPDGTVRRTVNLYTLGEDGRIQRLSVFKQGW